MNSYNIYSKEEPATILYHAIATDEQQVKELADKNNIAIDNLEIELERENVKNELGKAYPSSFRDALVK